MIDQISLLIPRLGPVASPGQHRNHHEHRLLDCISHGHPAASCRRVYAVCFIHFCSDLSAKESLGPSKLVRTNPGKLVDTHVPIHAIPSDSVVS